VIRTAAEQLGTGACAAALPMKRIVDATWARMA
jgi:hypothetical protein